MNKSKIISLVVALIIMLQLSACSGPEPQLVVNNESDEDVLSTDVELPSDEYVSSTDEIYVHIAGAIVNPGVYRMNSGDRLYDVIMAAGGFTEEASSDYANLAEGLVDGQKYTIMTIEEVAAIETAEFQEELSSYTSDGLLDINMASSQELQELSGIGRSKADSIVAYREDNGAFLDIQDIMNVSGIGEGVFGQIKDYITVR